MNFEEFKEKIISEINRRMPEGETVTHNIIKNNGINRMGLVIISPNTNVSPVIYLEDYFNEINQGREFVHVFQNLWEDYMQNKTEEMTDISGFTEWEQAREKIVVRLVNYEKNIELLKAVPHDRFLNLAVVYYYVKYIERERVATILVRNCHLEYWRVGKNELATVAYANYRKYFPVDIKSMDELMTEIMGGVPVEVQEADEMLTGQAYVVINSLKLYGAAVLLFPDNFRKLADMWKSDLYILPSSVHEVIVVPVAGMEPEKLEEMVREVNQIQVMPEERLSDSVYRYCYERGEIERA